MVQSTETGTVYLVNTNVTVTNLASITGAADNQWNSAALSSLSVLTLPATGLVDGIYRAYAVDDAGNLSSASTNSVTIDSIAPTANFTAATDNVGSITGALTSGSITDDTALVLTGTNESGSGVKIYNGSTEIGSATVSGTNWSYTATVANGTTYQFNVKETDLAGHISDATSNFTVTGDTVAPTASVDTAAITSTGNAVIQSTATGTVVLLNTSASTTSGNAVVQSSETGTVYLVKTTVTVTNLASITGAALYQWNSVAISSADTDTNLSVAGLADGTYKVYAVDEAGGLSSASVNSVIIDTTPPSIDSVAITSAVGITGNLLNTGDVVSVTTTFTEQVIVDNSSGSPTLTLVVGSTNQTATYASGSGSTMLVFQYTIQSGEIDSDGISIEANALALNNATISDPIGFPAVITHSAVSANSSYLVDAQAPPVRLFTLSDTELKIGDNATVTLVFAEAVLLFSSSDDITISNLDNLTPSGTLSTMLSEDNVVWEGTFTPTPNTEDATNTLSLGTSYTDSAGNTGVSATTANYEIDTLAPTISGVAIDNATGVQNDFVNAGDVVSVTATFSESVIVDNGTPTLTLILGSVNRSATYVSGSGSRPLVFQYTIQTGDNDSNGISIGTDALDLDNATIRDAAGNDATLTHSSVDNNSGYKVDAILPTIDSVEIDNTTTGMQNNFLNASDAAGSDVVSATVTFSELVNVTGTPQLTLAIGSDNETANYTSVGSDNTSKLFKYTIQAGDNDTNGISIGTNVLALNSGTIRDPAGNNATITHSSVDNNSSYKVDTTPPTVDNFTMSDTELKIGDNATVTLEFSEPVCVSTSECTRSQTNVANPYFSNADITIPNLNSGPRQGVASGTLSEMMTSDDNETWTGTFTPAINAEDDNNSLSLGTGYTDLAGNNGPDNQTANYEIDTLAPTVISVEINSAATEGRLTYDSGAFGFLNAGDNVSVTATFSERIFIVDNSSGNPTLTLAVGSDNHTARYASGGDNSTAMVFRYTIVSGDTDTNGINIRADSLALNSSTIRDAALNDAILTHTQWSDNYAYIVDTTPPTVSSVAITSAPFSSAPSSLGLQNSFLNADDRVKETVTFNEVYPSAVIVDNASAATLTLDVGGTNRPAAYDSGNNSTPSSTNDNATLVFEYTIVSGDTDTDGINIVANALNSNSITIMDRAGNIATNSDLANSRVQDNPNYKVDTTPPSVVSFTMDDIEIKTNAGGVETATVTLVFSEPVCGASSGCSRIQTGSGPVFTTSDITVISDNGNVSASGSLDSSMSSSQANDNKSIWTGTFTPYAPREVPINKLSLATTYTDLAGNNGPDNETINFEVDTKRPEVDYFIMSDLTLRQNDNATVELRFSEPVIFSSDEAITIPVIDRGPNQGRASGTLSTMISDDNRTWTGTFLPNFSFDNGTACKTEDWTNRLVMSDNYTDIDNNTGTGETGPNYMVDNVDPIENGAPTITLDVASRSNDELILWAQTLEATTSPLGTSHLNTLGGFHGCCGGGIATLTVNFQEPVTVDYDTDNATTDNNSFANVDIDLSNATGTLATMQPTGDGSIWSARFRPTLDREVDNNTITLKVSWYDQVGNPGTTVTTSSYEVETYRPQATFTITIADNTTCEYSVCAYDNGSYRKALAPGDNGTLRVVFSDPNPEQIFNFNSDDDIDIIDRDGVNVNNKNYVSLSRMTTIDNGTTWEGVFTPADNSTGTGNQVQDTMEASYNLSFELKDGSFSDNKTNPGDDVRSEEFIVDTKGPYVTEVKLDDGIDSLADNVLPTNNTKSFNNRCIPIHSDIYVTFDYFMNTSSIIAQQMSTSCSGSMQVSSDNFSTDDNCIKIAHPPDISNSNKTFKLDPVDNLTYNTTYTVKVTTDVQDALGNNMTDNFTSDKFRTSAFHFTTPTSGAFLAVGQYGETFRSIDNGTSWDNGTCIFLNKTLYGATYENNTFVAVGAGGKIVKSTDNASSWQISTTSREEQLNGIALGGSTLNVVGHGGYNYISSNTGSSWSRGQLPTAGWQNLSPNGNAFYYNPNLYGVSFGNSTFVAVGDTGKIVRSTDNGANWSHVTTGRLVDSGSHRVSLYGTNHLRGVTFGNNTFVAVGYTGKIIRSTNEGSSWDNVTKVNNNNLYGVTFGNGTFVAVGQSGTIIKSTNNGASWSSSSSGGNTLNGVTFVNNIFMAVGEDGRIVKSTADGVTSTDDGSNWSSLTSRTTNDLKGVTFGD